MKYLVTGAAGFVGSNLTERLLQRGEEVIALDSLSRKGSDRNLQRLQEKYPHLKFKKVEIEDTSPIIYQERPDLVYHFAAQVAVTSSLENPLRDFKINAEGTFQVAKAAHDMGVPVVYTSTNKVFGDEVNKVPIIEFETRYDFGGDLEKRGIPADFPIDASHHTPYGVSKLVGDLYVREFGGVANRCSCMYGKNQHGLVDQGWVSFIASEKIKGDQVTIFGDGKQVRDLLHIDDVVGLMEMEGDALIHGEPDIQGEAFSIGGGYENTISLLELCSLWDISPIFSDWRPADQKVFYADTSKVREILGWAPRVNKEEGLKEIYNWTNSEIEAKTY